MAEALASTRVGVLGTGEVGGRLAAGFQSPGARRDDRLA
jgi:hypothetical protein